MVWNEQILLFPNDARRKIGIAGLKADLADTQIKYSKTLQLTQHQKNQACELFYQSEKMLQQLPNPEVGYGIRINNLPDPEQLRKKFQGICSVFNSEKV